MDSTQDMLAFDSMASTGGASTTFRVRKDFVPAVSTKVSEKVLDVASPVFDDVTSGVADADSYWVRAEQTGAGIPYRRLDKSVYGGYGKQYKSQEARSHVDGH